MSEAIADGKVVLIHYTLTVDGEVVDSSEGEDPLVYLHGHHNIVAGLEKALAGKQAGDAVKAQVEPEEGYGPLSGMPDVDVPASAFPEIEVETGMQFFTEDDQGNPVPVWVTQVTAETVSVTTNHPLAGKTLNFDVTVQSLREPTSEELSHGHPHGLDGSAHHH